MEIMNFMKCPWMISYPFWILVEEIAHDLTIDFDSAKHMLDDKKMNEALKIIRKFYVVLGTRLETEKAEEILQSDDPWTTMESFHFYDRYKGLIKNENQL